MEKRGKLLLAAFLVCIVVLLGRLYYIQITCGPVLAAAADSQQHIPVIHPYSRGIIYDRNMEKLTNTTCAYYYLISTENCTPDFRQLIGHIGGTKAGTKGEAYEVYAVSHFQATINRLLRTKHHAYGFCVSERYADEQPAAHLIGYVNEADGVGASGLEKMYEKQLGNRHPMIYLEGTGTGAVIEGMGINADGSADEPAAGLVTTLDKDLQVAVEACLTDYGVSGSVIVADVDTGQILAMASRPGYNPNKLEQYLGNEGSELVNKAVQCQYAAGPILDVLHEVASLGKVSLIDITSSLGFGQCVWENFPDEATGSLPEVNLPEVNVQRDREPVVGAAGAASESEAGGRKRAELSKDSEQVKDVMQRLKQSMEVTPIQVCQMLVTLANLGEKVPLSIVKSTAKGEDFPYVDFGSADVEAYLDENIADNPVTGSGWAAGLCGGVMVGAPQSAETRFDEIQPVEMPPTEMLPMEMLPDRVIVVHVEDQNQKALEIFREIREIVLRLELS